MLQVQEGSLSELAELFERYHVRLFNFFLKMTLERQISEDLTQNVFVRVIKYRHTYKQRNGSFKTWLYQLARNVHADFHKHEKKLAERFKRPGNLRERGLEEFGDEESGYGEEEGDVPDEGYREDQYRQLDSALGRLQQAQREIIILSRYQGLRYTEIARIRNISVAAVKVQVHRAIKELRKVYFRDL
jgi:RNA polymerase sigma-70 factor (ECF subfamily)